MGFNQDVPPYLGYSPDTVGIYGGFSYDPRLKRVFFVMKATPRLCLGRDPKGAKLTACDDASVLPVQFADMVFPPSVAERKWTNVRQKSCLSYRSTQATSDAIAGPCATAPALRFENDQIKDSGGRCLEAPTKANLAGARFSPCSDFNNNQRFLVQDVGKLLPGESVIRLRDAEFCLEVEGDGR